MPALNYKFFKELFDVLDVNKVHNNFASFLQTYKLSPEEANRVLRGLYLIAYLNVRQQFEDYLKKNPKVTVSFGKVLASNPKVIELQKAVDLISVAAFKNTFLGKIEEEMSNLLKNLTTEGKTWIEVMKYVVVLAEEDLDKAQKIADYLSEKRYAKVLALIK